MACGARKESVRIWRESKKRIAGKERRRKECRSRERRKVGKGKRKSVDDHVELADYPHEATVIAGKRSIGCDYYYCAFSHAITNPPSSPIANKLWARTPVGVGTVLPEAEGDGTELELLVVDGPEVLEGGRVLVLLGLVLVLVLVGEGGGVEEVLVVVDVGLDSSLP